MPADPRQAPPEVEAMVRRHLQDHSSPATPRPAATVLLVREGEQDDQVFLMDRISGVAFAPGYTAFPGGAVEAEDGTVEPEGDSEVLVDWAAAFGCSPVEARALLGCAVRELFEETGVLLACSADGSTLRELGSRGKELRSLLLRGRVSLTDVLADLDAVLSPRLLTPWARWITPAWSPRRYDTYFFVAVLPPGQRADGGGGEASSVAWRTAAEALDRVEQGKSVMLTPTSTTLAELVGAPRVHELVTRPRPLGPHTFELGPGRQTVSRSHWSRPKVVRPSSSSPDDHVAAPAPRRGA